MYRVLLFFTFFSSTLFAQQTQKYIERQGRVTFFSYTSVENIEANNDQVLSFFEPSTNSVAVSILMNAFKFKKSLMYNHFNESYIESDLYPKATFEGVINGYDPNSDRTQTKIIKGKITLRDISKDIEIKSKITREDSGYRITGNLSLNIDDFNIKVPALLAPNIAKTIAISFEFKYGFYEK